MQSRVHVAFVEQDSLLLIQGCW